jgi:alpha-L-arabinofuranosidase
MWEAPENHPVDRQTIMAYAWFLPHGVPIGMLEYMNQNKVVELSQLFESLQIRKAKFTPGWRSNPYWRIEKPKAKEIMVAVWELEDGKSLLAVVSNLKVDEKVEISLKWTGNKNAKITNALSGEEIKATNGLYNLQIESENFLLLLAKW